jgi:hypothetical protein
MIASQFLISHVARHALRACATIAVENFERVDLIREESF